jgi:hypothetical protein
MINLVEIVGAVAIVVSLVFVAYELRQANRLGRLEAMQSLADAWLSSGLEISGNRELALVLEKISHGATEGDFDGAESYQAMSFMYAADHNWQLRFSQLELGVLKAEDYSFPHPANATYNSNSHREIWPTIRKDFSEKFAAFWEQRFELSSESHESKGAT